MYGQEFGFYVEMDLDYLEENRWEIIGRSDVAQLIVQDKIIFAFTSFTLSFDILSMVIIK